MEEKDIHERQVNNENEKEVKSLAIKGFFWRFLQNGSSRLISFIIGLILARLLTPEDYGLVSMVSVFTVIMMVFVTTGFSSAIVQKKEINNEELSTLFYCGLVVSGVLYAIMYFAAPFIADFYHEPQLVEILRIYSLCLPLAALYSVPMSLLNRRLQFKYTMIAGLIAAVVHGVVGFTMAFAEFGVWALVYSSLAMYVTEGICIFVLGKWRPNLYFSFKLLGPLFGFSSKVLAINLINQIFNNIRSLIIGRVYSSEQLAYYNKGYQFPTIIMGQVEGSMTSVMFASLSKFQDTWESKGLPALRRSMKLSLFVCSPLMAGMCAVAEPMIRFLLTDKWLPSVPFVRLVAILCITWPLAACSHAMNARGFSGVTLKLNLIGKAITLIAILLSYKISVEALITSTIMASYISLCISCLFYRKYLLYSIKDQMFDVLPSLLISAVMGIMVWGLTFIPMLDILMLILQVSCGTVLYIVLSFVFNRDMFKYNWNMIAKFLKIKKAKN